MTPSSFYFARFAAHLFFPQRCTAVAKCAHCTEIPALPVSMKNVAHSSSEGKEPGLLHKKAFEEIDL